LGSGFLGTGTQTGFPKLGTLLQIAKNRISGRVPGSGVLGTRCAFSFLGTRNPVWVPVPRNPVWVPVPRNPGTHSDYLKIKEKLSKHSSVFKNVQRQSFKWVPFPKNPEPGMRSRSQEPGNP